MASQRGHKTAIIIIKLHPKLVHVITCLCLADDGGDYGSIVGFPMMMMPPQPMYNSYGGGGGGGAFDSFVGGGMMFGNGAFF